jgi:hypothetical protein
MIICFIDYSSEKYSIIIYLAIRVSVFCSTFWEAVLYDQALTDRISILIFGVNPSGSGCVFCFRLDFFFWKVCLFCPPQEVKKTNIKNNAYTCAYFIIYLLSNPLCEVHVYKLFYSLVLHSRPILLDMNTWARAIRYGFL